MISAVAIRTGACWWCGQPADSREHKFKRTDLVREFGRPPYTGDETLVRYSDGERWEMRSSKSGPLKFSSTLCGSCNSTRSQPFDVAYDRFVGWLLDNEDQVLDAREVDFAAIFGPGWQEPALNVFRYFVKHMCCRIAELSSDEHPLEIPGDVIAFLDGGSPPSSVTLEVYVDPAMLRWCGLGRNDPKFSRPLWLESVFGPSPAGTPDMIQSRWRYGWLTVAWGVGSDAQPGDEFQRQRLDVPFIATMDADFEFAFAWGQSRKETLGEPPSEPVDPERSLADSPMAQAFLGGALDLEAGVRKRSPDERRGELSPDADVELDREVRRTQMMVNAARAAWSQGHLSRDAVLAALELPAGEDPDDLLAASRRLHAERSSEASWAALRVDFACMAILKLAEALSAGLETDEGQDALVEAAGLSGRCVMAAGLASDDAALGFDSVADAARTLARV